MFCWRAPGPCGALSHDGAYLLPIMFNVLSDGTVKHPYHVWIVDPHGRTVLLGLVTLAYPLPVLPTAALIALRLLFTRRSIDRFLFAGLDQCRVLLRAFHLCTAAARLHSNRPYMT